MSEFVEVFERAQDHYRRGEYGAALKRATEAYALAKSTEDERKDYHLSVVLNLLGSAHSESGQLQVAIQLFNQSLLHSNKANRLEEAATTHFNLGNTYRYANAWQDSEKHFKKAIEKAKAADRLDIAARSALTLLQFYARLGFDVHAAKGAKFSEYFELLEHIEGDEALWARYNLEASTWEKRGDLERTEEAYQKMAQIVRSLNASYQAENDLIYGTFLFKQGQLERSTTLLKTAYDKLSTIGDRRVVSASRTLGEIAIRMKHWPDADRYCVEALRHAQREYEGLNIDKRFLHAEQHGETARRYIDALLMQERWQDALEAMETYLGRIARDHRFHQQRKRHGERPLRVGASGRVFIEALDIGAMSKLVTERNVRVARYYVTQLGELVIILLQPGKPAIGYSAKGAGFKSTELLQKLADEYYAPPSLVRSSGKKSGRPTRSALSRFVELDPADRSIIEDLSQLLVPDPMKSALQDGSGSLLIICDHDLQSTPWTALMLSEENLLFEQFDISTSSSIGLFEQLDRRRDAPITPQGMLRLGAQETSIVFCSSEQQRSIPLLSILPNELETHDFVALPGVEAEVARVTELDRSHGGRTMVLSGDAMTPDLMESVFFSSGLVHFASHCYSAHEGWNSFLVLEYGDLRVKDIMDWHTEAELVVLSACNSGIASFNADTAISFPMAFLCGGSRAVVSTLWPIDDESTAIFMSELHSTMRSGGTVAQAFRAAITALRETPETESPYFWAAFQVQGDPFEQLDSAPYGGPIFHGGAISIGDKDVDWQALAELDVAPHEGCIINKAGPHKIGQSQR